MNILLLQHMRISQISQIVVGNFTNHTFLLFISYSTHASNRLLKQRGQLTPVVSVSLTEMVVQH